MVKEGEGRVLAGMYPNPSELTNESAGIHDLSERRTRFIIPRVVVRHPKKLHDPNGKTAPSLSPHQHRHRTVTSMALASEEAQTPEGDPSQGRASHKSKVCPGMQNMVRGVPDSLTGRATRPHSPQPTAMPSAETYACCRARASSRSPSNENTTVRAVCTRKFACAGKRPRPGSARKCCTS